jgi:hypothetical protein
MRTHCLALGVLLLASSAQAGDFDGPSTAEMTSRAVRFELDYAPTTRRQAEFASWATFVAGFLPLFVTSALQGTPGAGNISAAVGGVATSALWSFGPVVGDAANGDWRRFWYHGLGRMVLCGLSAGAFGLSNAIHGPGAIGLLLLISGGAGVGALAWAIIDLVDSGGAPARWVRRQLDEREPSDPDPRSE